MNPIFAAAVDALTQADAELRRLDSALVASATAAAAAEQRLERLRSNEAELNKINADLAQQVAHAREQITAADARVKAAAYEGQTIANERINTAHAKAKDILMVASSAAHKSSMEARAYIHGLRDQREEAEARLRDTHDRLQKSNDAFDALRKQAAAFAGN